MTSRPQQFFYADEISMAEKLATEIASDLKKTIDEKGRGLFILPGGKSPLPLIRELTKKSLPWEKIDITTTDERKVPLSDVGSNAGQISRLFDEAGVSANVHWLGEGHLPDLKWPSDVTILGMGLDGHYASIFPGTIISAEKSLVEITAPFAPAERVTLTLKVLTNTKRLILLVPDQPKFELCKKIIDGQGKNMPVSSLFEGCGDKIELHIVGAGQ